MTRLGQLWRRSLQTRVVLSTLLLSALVVGLTGWALLTSVAERLAERRQEAVVAQAKSAFESAQAQLDAEVETQPAAQSQTLTELVDAVTRTDEPARVFDLVLEGPLTSGAEVIPRRSSVALADDAVPSDLQETVRGTPGVFWRYSDLTVLSSGEDVPTVVVGRQLQAPSTGETYALYYLYSLAEQQATVDLVRQALLVGGPAMVLMVGGVAWLVSRQVLGPVRLARRVAERYAAGSLEQRMHVSGEDDIARLSTSFNQMAASLQNQIRRLEDLSRLQQRFVSDVSHELRTPLTTVQMASEVLHDERRRFDPKTARAAELLKGELDRFEELLSNLLDLSRFDAGAAQLELSDVDLAEVARQTVQDPVASRLGVRVRVVGDRAAAVVEADVRRVDRIVRNLVANAAKYSGSDVIEIEVGQRSDLASLVVRDFGVGLADDENLRVFDRFWRADPARAQGGTGLGLAIAREDAALHGGTLVAFGRSGRGAEFVLTLPKQVTRREQVSVIGPAVRLRYA
ncbi:MtrAB system histidine kinase MtrB [Aeromicrobium sp. CTD01-1L150]|uniref:MtrAB system histidine kinase MtrB n=1 Tax=Aeromicrobium sp. CTD01-1L150 TaxID=3341830 RepID=UPI0035BF2508